eukprot:762817-Hanusia_phi.AAC.2
MPLVSLRLDGPTLQQFLVWLPCGFGLFFLTVNLKIPAASARGFAAHDAMSWSMMPDAYYTALYVNSSSLPPRLLLPEWIEHRAEHNNCPSMVTVDVSCYKTTCTEDIEVTLALPATASADDMLGRSCLLWKTAKQTRPAQLTSLVRI